LDETLYRPALLAYTLYAFYFVLVNTSTTNSMQFAKQVYISATDEDQIFDQRLLRFIAVVILSLLCLLHYFSARTGRALNVTLAASKVVMLVVLFIAGAIKAGRSNVHDFFTKNDSSPSSGVSSAAAGFISILFSFQGWENATFVG
jgi:amino acid transporter